MRRAVLAGTVYFATMFALGFVLGTVRVLLIEPRLGGWLATVTELPIMLGAAWFVCAWFVRRFDVPARRNGRMLMGAIAFVLLMIAEVFLGLSLFGRRMPEQLSEMTSGPGVLGLFGQVAFAAFPIAQLPRKAAA